MDYDDKGNLKIRPELLYDKIDRLDAKITEATGSNYNLSSSRHDTNSTKGYKLPPTYNKSPNNFLNHQGESVAYEFKQLRRLYKSKRYRFERLIDLITGRKPNWKKLQRELTLRDINFLTETFHGETAFLKESINDIEKNNGLSEKEKQRRIHARKWFEFTRALNNGQVRQDLIKYNNKKR